MPYEAAKNLEQRRSPKIESNMDEKPTLITSIQLDDGMFMFFFLQRILTLRDIH